MKAFAFTSVLATVAFASVAHAEIVVHVGENQTFASLDGAMAAIPAPPTDDYRFLVHPGTYTGGSRWSGYRIHASISAAQTSSEHTITVTAFDPTQPPVFDGEGLVDEFFWLRDNPVPARDTNVVFEHLIIQNYRLMGVHFGSPDSGGTWHNTVRDCVIRDIGGVFGDAALGYAGIQLHHSSFNVFERNTFININNGNQGHAFYYGGVSVGNVARHNTILDSDGDVFKLREGSLDNVFEGNYVRGSAMQCVVQSYSETTQDGVSIHGQNTMVRGNTFVYPHPATAVAAELPVDLACYHRTPGGWDHDGWTNSPETFDIAADNLNFGHFATSMVVRGLTAGDYDDDGHVDVVKATWTDAVDGEAAHGIVDQTIRYDRGYWAGLLYSSRAWQVDAMATGDFDGDGRPEVVTAFWNGTYARIYRGDGAPFASGLTGLRRLYEGSGTGWRVVAMTAGDFDPEGPDELVVAFDNGTIRRVCLASAAGIDELSPVESCHEIYSSEAWKITAMTTGRDGASDRVITAFQSGTQSNIYAGDGVTGLTNVRKIHASSINERVTAIAAVETGAPRTQLVTAFVRADGLTEVWRGSSGATSGAKNGGLVYSSPSFRVTHLLAADMRGDTLDEVVTVFQRKDGAGLNRTVQIWEGRPDNLLGQRKLFEWARP